LLLLGVALGCVVWPPRVTRWDAETGGLPFVIAWFAIPFLSLVIISRWTSTDVMVTRYFLSTVPALALLVALLVRRIGKSWPQVLLVVAFGAYAITRFFSASHTDEDWRAAAALDRSLVTDAGTPVVLFAGFIEAKQASWLRDPEKRSYLNAPTTAYPFEGGPVHPLPFGLDEETTPYMDELAEDLEASTGFVLVNRGADNHAVWLTERLSAAGFTAVERGNFGAQIRVYEFTRSATTEPPGGPS
jgi:hypothetical protein